MERSTVVEVEYAARGSGGPTGKSAYESAQDEGFVGTEAEWVDSLAGDSAYEIAVANGFVGTEEEWLASLDGEDAAGADNTAFATSWDGVTDVSPSKNTVYDEMITRLPVSSDWMGGAWGQNFRMYRPRNSHAPGSPLNSEGGVGIISKDETSLAYLYSHNNGYASFECQNNDASKWMSFGLHSSGNFQCTTGGGPLGFNVRPQVGGVNVALVTDVSAPAGTEWGDITGTLSDQTDLNTALGGKASTAVFTSSVNGLAPASGGGTTNFLRADGTWAAPPGGGGGSGSTSDDPYGSGWNGATTVSPSQNAVYDKIESVVASIPSVSGYAPLMPPDATLQLGDATHRYTWLYSRNIWLYEPNGCALFMQNNWNLWTIVADSPDLLTISQYATAPVFSLTKLGALTIAGALTLADEAYGSGWDGKLQAPTKNAVYDQMETRALKGAVTTSGLTQATSKLLGRVTASSGAVEELTGTQATGLLDTFTTSAKGLAPASGGGTTNFLRADGTWAAPAGGGGGATWGSITGTLSAQTDLNTELNKKLTVQTYSGTWAQAVGWEGFVFNAAGGGQVWMAVDTGVGYVGGWDSLTGTHTWEIGVLNARTRFKIDGYGTGSFEFQEQPYYLTNAMYHQGNLTLSTLGGATAGAITASGLTINTAKLAGRTTGGSGALEEIGVGATLSLASATLGVAKVPNLLTINNGGAGAASGATYDGSAAITISYNTTGAAKAGAITGSLLTMNTARLVGRTTASNGAPEEISAGATLSLSGGTLGVASVPNAVTWNNGGAGAASGSTYNGSAAVTVSYNTIGAAPDVPRTQAAGSDSITPTFSNDVVTRLAAAGAITLNNPTGTAVDSWGLVIKLRSTGVQTISYGTQYRAIGVTLPTATVANKLIILGLIYNSTDTKWDVVAVAQEA